MMPGFTPTSSSVRFGGMVSRRREVEVDGGVEVREVGCVVGDRDSGVEGGVLPAERERVMRRGVGVGMSVSAVGVDAPDGVEDLIRLDRRWGCEVSSGDDAVRLRASGMAIGVVVLDAASAAAAFVEMFFEAWKY
jgi:hypothetical protein